MKRKARQDCIAALNLSPTTAGKQCKAHAFLGGWKHTSHAQDNWPSESGPVITSHLAESVFVQVNHAWFRSGRTIPNMS